MRLHHILARVGVVFFCLLSADASRAKQLSGDNGKTKSLAAKTVTVTNCVKLKRALGDSRVERIDVAGEIWCSRAIWGTPVLVRRNLEVRGQIDEAEGVSKKVNSIHLADLSKGVLVERGAVFFLHDLFLHQRDMGIVGIDVPFIKSRKGGTVVLAGVVVIVKSCPVPVDSYSTVANALPRPEFSSGSQRTSPVDKNVLLVKDLAIWLPSPSNSFWQICSTVFDCAASSSRINQYLEDDLVATCG